MASLLRLRRLGIDTYQEPVLYVHHDSPVCRSEGFESQSRVELLLEGRSVVATLNVVTGDFLGPQEAGLSESAWRMLSPQEGAMGSVRHAPQLASLSHLRSKIHGWPLSTEGVQAIVGDVAAGRYSELQLAAFVTACAGKRLDLRETAALTRAMVDAGERIEWRDAPVMDKHCVGGLPGNRTTMIVVPIVAACGLRIPKTSSRAITSPAGTADAMETIAPVDLDVPAIRRVVGRTGGCIVWGGAVRLSPADDILIRVERPLELDSQEQLVASILSKKAAAGATHVVIDMPVGPTAKVRSAEAAALLSHQLERVALAMGMQLRVVRTDGVQPVGRGIGPALEARDVLSVLKNERDAPADLADRALLLAAELLEFGGAATHGQGLQRARSVLASGKAWARFQDICEAQGGMSEPRLAAYRREVTAEARGSIAAIDNRRLARIAKLAGAPVAACAGLDLHVRLGDRVERDQPLFTLHAESPGELAYALAYATQQSDTVQVKRDA